MAVGVSHSVANVILERFSLHAVEEGSASAFGELTFSPTEALRFMAGVRGDTYSFDVKALDPGSLSGKADASIASPKFGVAWRPVDYLELYGNWGQGFHSNDGRGAAVGDPPVPGLVKGTGKEVGARVQFGEFNLTGAYWWLENDSELIFVGDFELGRTQGQQRAPRLRVRAVLAAV